MSQRASPIRGLQPYGKDTALQNYALLTENQRLTQMLLSKNAEIQALLEANKSIKNSYESQAAAYRKTIDMLERQLNQNERFRQAQFQSIRDKYYKQTSEDMSSLKFSHTNEIQFLFKEIAELRASLETSSSKISVKEHELETVRESYDRELAANTRQINTLNKMIIQSEENTQKEIKDLTNKRQLQKSRASGIVSSRKETSQYMEKQIRKLNEEVLEKTILIENINREINKEKKRCEEITKSFNKKIEAITEDYQSQIADKQHHFDKIQKMLKQEILEYKEKQMKLLHQNQGLKSQANSLKKDNENKNETIKQKVEEILKFKEMLEKMREDHLNEMNNLMKEKRKRNSKSNLGSSRSLSSSMKESGILDSPSVDTHSYQLPSKIATFLPTVKEESPDRKDLSQELNRSQIEEEEDNELARAIFHYDSVIDQLKKSHSMELQFYKHNYDKLNRKFQQKELELEDVLTKFSPLVKIHADQKSLEEDRKERIERHWKADLALLEVLLKKHKIQVF